MKKTELLQIRVSPALKQALKTEAEKQGKTMSAFIEESLTLLMESPDLEKKINDIDAKTEELFGMMEKITQKLFPK